MRSQAKTGGLPGLLGRNGRRSGTGAPRFRSLGHEMGKRKPYLRSTVWALFLWAALRIGNYAAAFPWVLNDAPDVTQDIRTRVEFAYAAAHTAAQATNSVTNLWHLGRAAFDRAALESRAETKSSFAEVGITASRAALQKDPKSAPAHYYLALCLGELARTRKFSALRLIREMQQEFERARGLDETLDFAGPDRGLGMLYLEAPGWPTSIGDRKKARSHLEQAVKLAGEYPDNHLSLLEALLRAKDARATEAEWAVLESIWPKAREQFSGESWDNDWIDWESRRAGLEARVRRLLPRTLAK